MAGFGGTPDEAFADFDKRWFTHRGPSAFRGNVVIDEPVRAFATVQKVADLV